MRFGLMLMLLAACATTETWPADVKPQPPAAARETSCLGAVPKTPWHDICWLPKQDKLVWAWNRPAKHAPDELAKFGGFPCMVRLLRGVRSLYFPRPQRNGFDSPGLIIYGDMPRDATIACLRKAYGTMSITDTGTVAAISLPKYPTMYLAWQRQDDEDMLTMWPQETLTEEYLRLAQTRVRRQPLAVRSLTKALPADTYSWAHGLFGNNRRFIFSTRLSAAGRTVTTKITFVFGRSTTTQSLSESLRTALAGNDRKIAVSADNNRLTATCVHPRTDYETLRADLYRWIAAQSKR